MRSWLDNPQLRHPLYLPLLLVALILALYYPAVGSGIHPIDDPGIVTLYGSSPSLLQVLLPGDGYYYRPLLQLSFWLDNRLWAMASAPMHLENILLHCANTLLVFCLARRVTAALSSSAPSSMVNSQSSIVPPLLAALLFGLHPVNVEAVNWIAGRSDPLLAFFVLGATLFWLRWLDAPRWHDFGGALLLFGAALMTKETALAAAAVAFLLALAWPGKATPRQRAAAVGVVLSPALLLVLFALFFWRGVHSLRRFLSMTDLDLLQGAMDALTAFGFYARKLVVPVPLNFAITEVHPLHGLLGVALLPVLCLLLLRRRLPGVLLISAAFLVLPAVLVAVQQVAWTPYAERYLYLPSAFFVLGLCAFFSPARSPGPAALLLALLVVTAFAGLTLKRTMLWTDKLAFLEKTIASSPRLGSLYSQLGDVLLQRNELDRAAEAFATADRLNQRESVRLVIKANLMGVQLAKGNYAAVRSQFFGIFARKQDAPPEFLEILYKADGRRMHGLSGKEKAELAEDLLETLDLLHQKRYDPFWLYRSGLLSLELGDRARARDFFQRSYTAAPVDAHYKKAAEIFLHKMERSK
ncbi:MAG: hypothetical protein A2075_15555 [Geobacteraceae bacterium GWC2_58_44]|nr:MAG: hypothetical protein A2075_15555 [Geobacteraceae bacterium GWC2_58_44]HBG06001.1 hypothetical protein [Geobacter sp.]